MASRKFLGFIELKGKSKGAQAAFGRTGKAADKLGSKFKQLGALAAAAGVATVFVGTAKKIQEFEKSLSDLSAITGAAGADLLQLEKASKKIGQTTTLSASQAAEAFKLMASAKPDLLENLDALERTTKAAVTLAEAAGIELPAAANALGESLNQFGAGAEKAEEFINILAAGSKFGASSIEDVSSALVNVGTVASLASLSFEETNAALQALAAGGLKGSLAGSKLRTVLVRLQTQANDKFNPAVVGINAALENLAIANLTVTEKVKIFGQEAISTADLLVMQRGTLDDLEVKLTGTSTAYEQASIRVDNLDGDLKRLTSGFEALQINLGQQSLPVLRNTVVAFTDVFNALAALNKPDGIADTSDQFSILDATIKTLFTSAVVLKNLFDVIADVLGFVGRSVVAALSGQFDLIPLAFDELKKDLAEEMEDVGEFAFRTFNPEGAAILDANMEAFYKKPIVEKVAETAKIIAEMPETAGEQVARKLAEKKIAALDADLERIRQGLLSEEEAERESLATKLDILTEGLALKRITQEEFDLQVVLSAQELADKLAKIQADAAKKEIAFSKMTAKGKTQVVLGEAITLTQGVAQHSKTLFKINKAAALAQAIVALPAHVSETMSKYPYPISVAMGALAAAASIAQIQAIKQTSFTGGGGGTTPSAAGSLPVINDIPVGVGGVPLDLPPGIGGTGDGGLGTRIDINIEGLTEGGVFSSADVRALIESIDEELGDGISLGTGGGG